MSANSFYWNMKSEIGFVGWWVSRVHEQKDKLMTSKNNLGWHLANVLCVYLNDHIYGQKLKPQYKTDKINANWERGF